MASRIPNGCTTPLIAISILCAKWKLAMWTIHDMYMKHIKLTQTERKLTVDCLVHHLPEVT